MRLWKAWLSHAWSRFDPYGGHVVRASTFHRLATVALVGVALMGHVVVEAGVVLPPGRDVPGAVDVQQGQGPCWGRWMYNKGGARIRNKSRC